MVKRWKLDDTCMYSWPRIESKKPGKVSLGFEWELPIYWDEWEELNDRLRDHWSYDYESNSRLRNWRAEEAPINDTTKAMLDRYWFRYHSECGGLEVCSPITNNVATLRALASKIRTRAMKDRLINVTDLQESTSCGIHVSYSYGGMDIDEDTNRLNAMLHRESSENFLWEFSYRDNAVHSDYEHQARSTRWDKWDSRPDFYELAELETAREQSNRVELRIWDAHESRIIPAIEFTHACAKFLQQEITELPYIKQMKEWLAKQPGYKTLKNDPAWAYV